MRSDRTLLRWYKIINKRFFDGACPDRVCIRWADPEDSHWEKKCFGEASLSVDDEHHDYQIVMSKSLNEQWVTRMSTLVHEMIHLATQLRDDHGPAFERWRQLLSDRGLFKKHALRRGCTLF
jgi:hypothetical protein